MRTTVKAKLGKSASVFQQIDYWASCFKDTLAWFLANQHRAVGEGIQVASAHIPESWLWAIRLLLVGPSKVFSRLQQRTDSRETLPYTGLQLTNTRSLLKPCSPTMNQGLLKLRSPWVCTLEHGSHSQVFLGLSDFKRLCFLSLLPHHALLSADHLSPCCCCC